MAKKYSREELLLLYERAQSAFRCCIENEENAFLREEINVSLESIEIKNHFIQIKFDGDDPYSSAIEIRLALTTQAGQDLGYYSFIMNESFEQIDDILVFY
jgi:hypothetical protein